MTEDNWHWWRVAGAAMLESSSLRLGARIGGIA